MNREQLRALQGPVKEKYQQDPDAAKVRFRADGHIADGIAWRVETGRGPIEAGLHPAAGGDRPLACSADMLLEALVACAGVTLRAVAAARNVELRDARIVAEGDIDFRGTLGMSEDVPVGFQAIRLRFELDSDAPDEKLDRIVEVTERYCIVFQTLQHTTPISTTRVRMAKVITA